MKAIKTCGDCKYFEQGENNSFCGNKKKRSESLKKYLYYCFASCSLFEEGIAESRKQYMINVLKDKIKEVEKL